MQWLVRAASAGSETIAPEVVLAVQLAVEGAKWAAPFIKSYFDGPKTLEELQAAAKNPQTGYEIHHIVEQTPAEKDGYPRSQIDADDNLVRIPTLKHWELNRWYEKPNEKYGGLSPREYLKGKDWETRRKVGLDGLREVGVLKR